MPIGFHFCATCGSIAYWRGLLTRHMGRRRIADDPKAVAAIPLEHFDGFETFKDLRQDKKYVGDVWGSIW